MYLRARNSNTKVDSYSYKDEYPRFWIQTMYCVHFHEGHTLNLTPKTEKGTVVLIGFGGGISLFKIKINVGGREGVGRFTGLSLWTGWVGREAICLLFFPLLLQLAFVFPGIAVGTQGFVDCVYCVGEACCIVSFFQR
jgi:hypothetical protein